MRHLIHPYVRFFGIPSQFITWYSIGFFMLLTFSPFPSYSKNSSVLYLKIVRIAGLNEYKFETVI